MLVFAASFWLALWENDFNICSADMGVDDDIIPGMKKFEPNKAALEDVTQAGEEFTDVLPTKV